MIYMILCRKTTESSKVKETSHNLIEYFGKRKIKETPWSISMIARVYYKEANGTVPALTEEYTSVFNSRTVHLKFHYILVIHQ